MFKVTLTISEWRMWNPVIASWRGEMCGYSDSFPTINDAICYFAAVENVFFDNQTDIDVDPDAIIQKYRIDRNMSFCESLIS